MEIFKVSSVSTPNMVAGAIAGAIRQSGQAELQAIGAGAINQAMKSVAVARQFLESELDLVCTPSFVDVDVNGETRTAIRLFLDPRCQNTANNP